MVQRPTVVYVHGNGVQPAAAALKESWDIALFGAPAGDRSVMAYWSDLLHPQPPTDGGPELPEIPEADPGEVRDEVEPAELIAETLAEIKGTGLELPGGATARLDPWLTEMAYVADALANGDSGVTAEALPLPRAARVAIFRALVKRTFADVYAYFFDGAGDALRDRLRKRLDAIDGRAVVIGHSLGSIIAYDTLSRTAHDVPLLVTIGSPLAVTEVQDLVSQPLRVPDGVLQWRNVADGRDLVALDPTIRPEYAPADRTTDFLVVNDSPSHHGGLEYLASQPVRSAVAALTA
ncbi:MAG TPA: hypothetical protein VNO83_10935 [Pseudonocardia sp.]|nr:hypothetical protein [Pseudonocardia sp.]